MNVNIPCENGTYKVIDMLGNYIILEATNNQLELEIGPYPIFIQEM